MKWFRAVSTIVFCLMICLAIPAFSQDERHDTPDAAHDERHDQDRDDHRDQANDDHNQEREHGDQDRDHDQAEHREDREQRAGRIPDDRFRANFGREHTFRIGHPVIVEGRPRFQYGGYWFIIAQPWPEGWRYSDPVYIDYVSGGYYVFNPVHPGIQISINVVF